MGDSSGGREGREARERERDWERERERLLLSDSKDSHSVYSSAPLSPLRSEEFDYQQSNITLLKAQLKLVTHERDNLKKDVKRISQERDGAYRHLSLSASPQSSLETAASHHRTNSDTAPTIAKSGPSSTLSRSHSIASAGDKCLVLPSERGGRGMPDLEKNPDRLLHELHIARKQHSDGAKKVDQAMKDVEYYRQEAENLRSRYNDVILEKQRLEQEVSSLRRFLEEDRKEMLEMRRQHQEILNVEGGPNESMSIMYGTLLRKYEAIKDDYGLVSKRYDDLVASHSAAVAQLEHCQEEIVRYKKQYEDMLTERNKFKQQCTQAIRQWDQALREKNDYRDALAKVQRQHEEAVKEINQAMAVRIKASKDIKRLTEERNAAMQEYSMIMSERDSVHKEIEKLQDDVSTTNSKMKEVESKSKIHDEEKRKLVCQIELLRREIDAALVDRDRTIKEAHELREKLGERDKSSTGSKSTAEGEGRNDASRQSRSDTDPHKERASASTEHLALLSAKDGADRTKVENLEQAVAEIERLRKEAEKLQGELTDARLEEDVAKGRRDWAYSERDKVVKERESIRTLCDKLRRERDGAVTQLAEALNDLDAVKKTRIEVVKENRELRERIESVEKDARIRMLQRSVGQSHSRDSAIDTDLQDWETETLDIDMGKISNDDDLGLDLAGGRDDPVCPGENPIYIASISKGSVVEGKLKVNDCILRVNNIDCRDVDRGTIISTLRGAGSSVSLVVRRRRAGRRYQAVLHLNEQRGRQDHGLTLDSGIYVSRISPGSVSARESVIAVGDRVLDINGANMDHVRSVQDATALLNQAHDILSITLQKNSASYGPLSSSSSGHCMMEEDKLTSPKTFSAATSPIKDTIKHGSRELAKKLISRDVQTEKYAGFNSSSSSEKVYNVNKAGSRESKSPWGQFTETVKEKFETVRGRRYSKEQGERERLDTSDTSRRCESGHYSDSGRRFNSRSREDGSREPPPFVDQDKEDALAELDSVLNSYHMSTASGSSGKGSGSSGKKKRKDRDSFKNGGTWPRARGGPIIEHSTGTILHPHKYKERLPLSELLTNVPKYPLEQEDEERPPEPERPPVIFRADDRTRHSRNKYRDHRATTYDLVSSYADRPEPPFHMLGPALSRESSLGDRLQNNLSRDGSEDRKAGYLSVLTPSDTSIDDSVKSVNVGKEVLAKYLGKIKPSRLATSDSEHTSPVEQLGHPMAGMQQQQYKEASKAVQYYHLHPSLHGRSSQSGFSPYFPTHQHPSTSMALHQIMSSPRYSSPPPLLPPTPGDMGSPHRPYEDHSRLYPPLEPPQSLSSISPTSDLYHSPSPSLEMFTGKSRLLPQHSSHLHHPSPSYHPPYGPGSAASSVFGPGASGLLPSHSHGNSSVMLPHPMSYRLADDREMVSPPTYPESYNRSVRYNQDPPRVVQRRIPSNPSVGSKGSYKISTDSISRNSERSSPLPSYHVEILSPGRRDPLALPYHKPSPGEIRQIHIEKSSEHLGIMIQEGAVGGASSAGSAGGVFVSSVSTNSLASQAGLQVGDQLLEVCGINLRMANYDQAAQVLHRVGNSIDIKVQFNPDKFQVEEASDSGEETESSDEEEEHAPALPRRSSPQRSGSPTPRNSPKVSRAPLQLEDRPPSSSMRSPLAMSLVPSAHSTLTRQQVQMIQARMARGPPLMLPPDREAKPAGASFREKKSHEPRLVYPVMKKSGDLGVRLVGGNAVGIFIHSVDMDSPASKIGLCSADQILEYNGTDLKNATAEQAAYELAKPAENVAILVQFNPDRYNAIKDHPGDSYFVKAMFDRMPDSNDPLLLRFKKDDILYVDNTMYNGVPGHWSAWLVNQEGQKGTWGIVPSKYKVEEELLLKRTHGGEIDSDSSRRSSTSTRRSFFKRRKAARSSSRDSKELASYSDVHSLLSYSDSGTLHEEPAINSYVRVEKWDFMMTRPVLIVGPLADAVVDKLVSDHPNTFIRCQPEYVDSDMNALEKGVMDNVFVDFKRRGSHYECTTVSSIRDICDRNQHCVLDVHLGSVERLHHNQIFPIVLLIKFKSVKQIKEVKDPRYHAEKITQKDAKNIYEHTLKLESEYKPLISDVIQGGANLILLCDQIATKIEQEQNKTLWVPAGTIW